MRLVGTLPSQVDALQEVWRFRTDSLPIIVAVDAHVCIALILVLHVAVALKNMFKGTFGLARQVMFWSFALGAILPLIEFLQNLGSFGMAEAIVNWPEFPVENYPSLELSYLLTQARGLWVYSMQFVFLGIGFTLVSLMSLRYHTFPTAYSVFGLFVALSSFGVFIFELVSFSDIETFGAALGITFFVWAVFIVPAWLIATGIALRKFVPKVVVAPAAPTMQRRRHPGQRESNSDSAANDELKMKKPTALENSGSDETSD